MRSTPPVLLPMIYSCQYGIHGRESLFIFMQHTHIQPINPNQPEAEYIAQAASLLRQGKLVAFPTETVYGLGADALNPEAVQQIFVAKGRPLSDPLIVHIADESTLKQLVTAIPADAWQLARAFWPGPLTLILPAAAHVPKVVTAGLANVAIRMPRHPVALALIRATGSPIAAPSANRFMHVSPTTAQHVLADLHGRIPFILDGGPCIVGVESTVLDLCSQPPTILRPGGVSLEALRAIVPGVQLSSQQQPPTTAHHEQQALQSPGQMLIHYAPKVPAFLFEGTTAAIHTAMLREIQQRQAQQQQLGLLLADEDLATFQESGAHIYTLGSIQAPEQIAARLYAGLRTLEDTGAQLILCRSFEEIGLGLAIRDRLLKATGGKVIKV